MLLSDSCYHGYGNTIPSNLGEKKRLTTTAKKHELIRATCSSFRRSMMTTREQDHKEREKNSHFRLARPFIKAETCLSPGGDVERDAGG